MLMLCTSALIFTLGSSAHKGHPCCGLPICHYLLDSMPSIVYVNLIFEKMKMQ